MKNLQTLKKFAAIVVSAMMVLSTLAIPTFAADVESTISIAGVTNASAVEGFKIVERNTDDNSWQMVSAYGGKGTDEKWYVKDDKGALTSVEYDFQNPSAAAITAIAKLVGNKAVSTAAKDITFTPGTNEGEYVNTGTDVGTWYVRVTAKDPGIIYNPMLVSRVSNEAKGLTADEAAAKQSDITFEKVVERKDGVAEGTNLDNDSTVGDALDTNPEGDNASAVSGYDGNRGDTAGSKSTDKDFIKYDPKTGKITTDNSKTVYDDVQFRINTKVPVYSDNYFEADPKPEFVVYDTLDEGLTYNGDVVVKVKGDEINATNADVKITPNKDSKTFVIEFTEAGLKKYAGENVEICYSAKLNDKHGVNFDAETNTAELWYTRNPGEDKKQGGERKTYHYTFEINGNVDAMSETENREVIKIGINDKGEQILRETVSKSDPTWTPLAGVEFELQDSDGNVVKKVVTDAKGVLRGMTQLDAGEYKLVEKKLPAEYSQYKVNSNSIDVVIDAKLDSVGRLDSYTVTVDDIVVGNYKKVYSPDGKSDKIQFLSQDGKTVEAEMACSGDNAGVVTDIGSVGSHKFTANGNSCVDTDTEAADIVNRPVGTLPSTGGMGTVLFTVGGIAIMALAIFLLFGGKKKQEQK